MLTYISLERAQEEVRSHCKAITETEYIPVMESVGRILAEDMRSAIDQPPFPRSPVDGYACVSSDLSGACKESPALLKVIGESDAGENKELQVKKGEAVRIMTGAPIPEGCDCCVYQEHTDLGEDWVNVYQSVNAWENYCFAGEDFKKDQILVKAGKKITYIEAAIASAMGVTRLLVFREISVTLITTGDEVTEPGIKLPYGKIYNSNQMLLAARLKEFGVKISNTITVKDDPCLLAEKLKDCVKKTDLIITTGGASVGKRDILQEALSIAGADVIFWKVAIKPGMPTLFSVLHQTPILSMSGNPYGVLITFEVLARPILRKMTQNPSFGLSYTKGTFYGSFQKKGQCRRFIRAIYQDGNVYLPEGLHSNGVLSSMAGCNCIIDAAETELPLEGKEEVSVILL